MDDHELIRLRAYEIWVREGQPEGRELEHWLLARRDILGTRAEQRDENLPPKTAEQSTDEPKTDETVLKESTELG